MTFHIVVIEAFQTEFIQDESIHLTLAFGRRYGDRVATIPAVALKLKGGAADLDS